MMNDTKNTSVKYVILGQHEIRCHSTTNKPQKYSSMNSTKSSKTSKNQLWKAIIMGFDFFKHENNEIDEIVTNSNSSIATTRMTTQVGTMAFMAPELLSRIDVNTLLPPD